VPAEKPLTGKSILVTRERSQAGRLSRSLEARGARTLVCPLIAFSPPSDWTPADRDLERLSEYDGLIFTSANAVEFTFQRLQARGIPLEDTQRIPTYAVGPATAEALASRGITVRRLPDAFQAEGLASLLGEETVQGRRFLFPRARKAREWLPRFLEERGARVDLAVVYQTRRADENAGLLQEFLCRERLDYLTFTSSSTVTAFTALAGPAAAREASRTSTAACIGEITAATARSEGFAHILTARPSTIPGLVKAIEDQVEGGV
jgi:uroporphyrinogen III methyltransferase/synthase